ncbi:zinc metalloprotease HtpX [Wohlfahrtiimonas chitiniclastica]|uniref:protease HtpX n=1 Tax=Wohlfahrtiimonas chitiniclastica TaxID=400946 RepID=UPI00036AD389|nr:protease HtpX [Wohlfahrtiimonas chitiniclastica]MBS7821313.1 protease HtpX [Wohlfahrtiimonas chitiniclastica]MBS7836868.1 protease HtpX [Wohlfahrtiimonas chitiniclastica]MBS7838904.1 protease HtpX [Wohlfahrtiimonas chitiniclastica]OYQ70088.1 zinc metalloprotease HtpX [Wohlfahrtiimonas chitiniclastica]OYQ79617.1 zinc metalloprotease HtpX [Wohlfahrtiimonas chitiniclastica]
MFKRILLWTVTNVAVIAVITVILSVTGLSGALNGGQGLLPMLLAAAVVGFTGSIISLLMSKKMAIHGMGVHIITEPSNQMEAWLVDTVHRQAKAAGIGLPDVGIFESADPNAFATGANKNAALVAVSTGLLHTMNRDEIEAVLGHEVAHVANGDMVTLTLIQGVVNTFVIFLSRIVANIITSALQGNNDDEAPVENSGTFFIVSFVLQIIFGFLASIIVAWFSRKREFKADEGGARLAGRDKMIGALQALQRGHANEDLPGNMAAFGISGKVANLFSTHPPLEERIDALRLQQR